jgi:ATPase family associated with various cellular activities (AAA)
MISFSRPQAKPHNTATEHPIMERTFSMFSPRESRNMPQSLPLSAPPAGPEKLDEKYRPQRLTDIVGQGFACMEISAFLEFPQSDAFFFSGPSGVGKSTMAHVMANELGINRDWNFYHILSSKMDVEAVNEALRMLRFRGIGDGWKMILCDEADTASSKALGIWLSALEDLPPKSIIVFTTNHPDKFSKPFRTRCQQIPFASDPKVLMQDAQVYLNRIWIGEKMEGPPPNVERFRDQIVEDGEISFRQVAKVVQRESWKQIARMSQPATPAKPTITASQFREVKASVVL